jgi:hypothetical protein
MAKTKSSHHKLLFPVVIIAFLFFALLMLINQASQNQIFDISASTHPIPLTP